jgi:hypothetical protein
MSRTILRNQREYKKNVYIFLYLAYLYETMKGKAVDEAAFLETVKKNLKEHGHEKEYRIPEDWKEKLERYLNQTGYILFDKVKPVKRDEDYAGTDEGCGMWYCPDKKSRIKNSGGRKRKGWEAGK